MNVTLFVEEDLVSRRNAESNEDTRGRVCKGGTTVRVGCGVVERSKCNPLRWYAHVRIY